MERHARREEVALQLSRGLRIRRGRRFEKAPEVSFDQTGPVDGHFVRAWLRLVLPESTPGRREDRVPTVTSSADRTQDRRGGRTVARIDRYQEIVVAGVSAGGLQGHAEGGTA